MSFKEKEAILEVIKVLSAKKNKYIKAMIGLDGFVDEIVHAVDKRMSVNDFSRIESMKEYGKRIVRSAGYSTNIEMVPIKQKLGGNGPILANALIKYGFDVTYIGAIGASKIDPAFDEMVSKCRAIGLSEPGRTDAIEFFDGKIISTKLETLKNICWESIIERIGFDDFVAMIDVCDLVGFENWTMVYNMSDILEHMISDVLPRLKPRKEKPIIFFDLADPEKRKDEDIAHVMHLIGEFSSNYHTVLGLNEKEAMEVACVLGLDVDNKKPNKLKSIADFIYQNLKIDIIVIHLIKSACVIHKEGYYFASGPYCKRPKLTTGAGDNFNAGFIFGLANGLNLEQAVILGNATSGFYVRSSKSPNEKEIIRFLGEWASGEIVDD